MLPHLRSQTHQKYHPHRDHICLKPKPLSFADGHEAHGVFAPNHAWRGFVVPGPTRKRTCPAHDEPNDSDPTPTGKPSTGRAPAEFWIPWADLLRKTVGVDPEICICGARMIVDDAITDGDKIAEVLARLGRRFAYFNGSTKEAAIHW